MKKLFVLMPLILALAACGGNGGEGGQGGGGSSYKNAVTATKTVDELATAGSWSDQTVHKDATLDDHITLGVTATDDNSGKYFANATYGGTWRLYKAGGAELTITASNAVITKVQVKFKYKTTDGAMTFGDLQGTPADDGTYTTVDGSMNVSNLASVSLAVAGDGKHIQVTQISVSYLK